MGLMSKYLQIKDDIVPEGIRKPLTFFKCLYALDAEEWKTAEKVAFEVDIPINTAMSYLKIAYRYGMADRKPIPSSAYGGGKVYAYRLNQSHYRFKGVKW